MGSVTASPQALIAAVGGSELVRCTSEPLPGSTGAATGSVERLTLQVRDPTGAISNHRVVRKRLRPLTEGRHAAASRAPDHSAYWRREALAYASGHLPAGPGLGAPDLLAVDGDDIDTREVTGGAESPAVAAYRLGEWQAVTRRGPGWTAGHCGAAEHRPRLRSHGVHRSAPPLSDACIKVSLS